MSTTDTLDHTPDATSDRPSRHRHPLRLASLVTGLVYLGIAAIWGLSQVVSVSAEDLGWLLPALLVLAGTVGLVAFAASQRRRDRAFDQEWAPYD